MRDLDASGKKLLIRVDFNVPQAADGSVADDRRIRSALPTIEYALGKGAAVILMSHLGRPKGDPAKDAKYTLKPVAHPLAELLKSNKVTLASDTVGTSAVENASKLQAGEVLLLENLRFDPREQAGDQGFAKQLRSLADCYVNDAFGTCHRKDASMFAVPSQFPKGQRVVGFLVEKELKILDELLGSAGRPMTAVLGGAKVSDKIAFIEALLSRVDQLLIGGAMTYTFRKAMGQSVGNSFVENDKLDLAKSLLEKAGAKLILPIDHLIAEKPEAAAATKISESEIPDGWCGMDIGPATVAKYAKIISGSKTVLWNGPVGKFEDEPFRKGTLGIAEAMAACQGVTVVGGGETAEAVENFGFAAKMTHVSTGGGAFLEYVEGKPFAALSVIDDA